MSLFPTFLLCLNILSDPTQFAKLVELDTRTRAVSEIVVESTVCIEIGVDFREGHGSGTIISKDGLILTAGHVGERSGLDCEITLADGRKLEAVTLGQIFLTQAHRGLDFDIGLVRLLDPPDDLTVAPISSSGSVERGEWVVAAGWVADVPETGQRAPVRIGRIQERMGPRLRLDAPFNGGDSGGGLFDLDGQLVGVISACGGIPNINFATPIDLYEFTKPLMLGGTTYSDPMPELEMMIVEVYKRLDEAERRMSDGLYRQVVARMDRMTSNPMWQNTPHVWFHAACGHGRFARHAYGLGEIGLLDEEIEKAWERLDRAITLGWWDLDHLQNDSDLAVLRKITPERWQDLLERVPEMIDWRSWVQMERSFSRGRKRTGSVDVDHLSDALREGVLKIADQRTTISLGTLVEDNLVLTKASSLPTRQRLRGIDYRDREYDLTLVYQDPAFDLAVLEIGPNDLTPMQFQTDKTPELGEVLLCVNAPGQAVVSARSAVGTPDSGDPESPFLGVEMSRFEENDRGVTIAGILRDGAAMAAGLRAGDLIVRVNGSEVGQSLREALQLFRVGDRVQVAIERDGVEMTVPVQLRRRPEYADGLPTPFGNDIVEANERRTGFGPAIRHDALLGPRDVGAPLVDLQGRVIGLQIAHADRSTNWALPAATLRSVLAEIPQRPSTRRSDQRVVVPLD
ncbi:MAG: trypsin-like peptidase domain-containing protein [Planctomycetota bacterium]|nr:trypsin-like peptidase domain-containing protein [Planctomycetota bacterium]